LAVTIDTVAASFSCRDVRGEMQASFLCLNFGVADAAPEYDKLFTPKKLMNYENVQTDL
jgi:hypothetical protein